MEIDISANRNQKLYIAHTGRFHLLNLLFIHISLNLANAIDKELFLKIQLTFYTVKGEISKHFFAGITLLLNTIAYVIYQFISVSCHFVYIDS